MRLLAETSGKNAIVITAAADEDAAIRDLVRSAFGHAGQKCSAASLAIVEAPLYDDPPLPASAGRRRAQRAGRRGRRPGDHDGSADRPAVTGVAASAHDARCRARRGWSSRGASTPARTCGRRVCDSASGRARGSTAPSASVRCSAWSAPTTSTTRSPSRTPADLGLTGGIQSLDEHEVDALARTRRGRQRVREPPHHRRHRAAPTLRRMEALVGRMRPEGGRAGVRRGVRQLEWRRRRSCRVRSRLADATSRSTTTRQRLRCERNVLRHRPLRRVGSGGACEPARPTSSWRAWPPRSPASRSSPITDAADLADAVAGRGLDRVRVLGPVDDAAAARLADHRVSTSTRRRPWRSPTSSCDGGCSSSRSAPPATATAACSRDPRS